MSDMIDRCGDCANWRERARNVPGKCVLNRPIPDGRWCASVWANDQACEAYEEEERDERSEG